MPWQGTYRPRTGWPSVAMRKNWNSTVFPRLETWRKTQDPDHFHGSRRKQVALACPCGKGILIDETLRVCPERCFVRRDRAICVLTRKPKQTNPQDSSMQADEVQNAKEPIAAQIDLSRQTLSETLLTRAHERPNWSRARSTLKRLSRSFALSGPHQVCQRRKSWRLHISAILFPRLYPGEFPFSNSLGRLQFPRRLQWTFLSPSRF